MAEKFKLSLDAGTARTQTGTYRTRSGGQLMGAIRPRSKSVSEPGLSLRELMGEAERRVGSLKQQQQSLTNDVLNAKSEQQAVLLSMEMEFECLQKMLEQRKAQLAFSVTASFDTYLDAMAALSEGVERRITALECSIEQTKAPADTTGMNALEVEDKMADIRGELEGSIHVSGEFSRDLSRASSQRPRLSYQSRQDSFQALLDSIGWVEEQLDSSSVLKVLEPPATPRDTSQFSPLAVAADTAGSVYVLDDGREGGTVHVFMKGVWTDSIGLLRETKLKKIPNCLCVTKDGLYVSYPDADTIAVIRKKNSEQIKLLNSHTLPALQPPLRSPRGLARLEEEGVVVADTGNDRVLVLSKFHLVVRTIEGTRHAPLHRPTSVGACSDGMIAVLHAGSSRVHVYRSSGRLRWRTCSFEVRTEAGDALPCEPIRIALHRTGEFKEPEVFLTATHAGEQCLLRYNLQKMWLRKMGRSGNKFGQFADLKGIEFCPEEGTILACDYGNKRLQVFKY